MIKERISGEVIWQKLKGDIHFLMAQGGGDDRIEVLGPYVRTLPKVLAQHLNMPANFTNILRAKLTLVEDMIAKGMIEKVCKATNPIIVSRYGNMENMLASMGALAANTVIKLRRAIENVPSVIADKGPTEVRLLYNCFFDDWETAVKCQAGQFTIGDVLFSKPTVIVQGMNF